MGEIKNKVYIRTDSDSERLAMEYVTLGVLPAKSLADAQHIAVASLNKIAYILSWNYSHMVSREELFVEANQKLKVHQVKIIQPDNFLRDHAKKK